MTHNELIHTYGDLVNHLDESFDDELRHLVEFDQLNWLPWIGSEWRNAKHRILIVAESHYGAKRGETAIQEKLDACSGDPMFTREIVLETGVGNWYASRLFGNIHRALLRTDALNEDSRTALWRHLAFCNFIQRPMENESARPAPTEFFSGWRCFVELLKVLHPETVIFIGVSAANHFDGAMSAMGMKHEIRVDQYRNGAYPRRFSVTYDGMVSTMVAIRHASQYFSWDIWNRYLQESLPDTLDYLRGFVFGNYEPSFDNDLSHEQESGRTIPKGLPVHLGHKPVLACDYQEINKALGCPDYDDPKFISVGHAQWDADDLSVKIFRRGSSGRWSRQSEEVPVQRLPFMMAMLLAAIYRVQHPTEGKISLIGESVVAPQDLDLMKEQLKNWSVSLATGLKMVKDILNRIDLEQL